MPSFFFWKVYTPLRIQWQWGVIMCRKRYLHGCCVGFLGMGLILGHCLESWLLCCPGGVGLIALGFWISRQK